MALTDVSPPQIGALPGKGAKRGPESMKGAKSAQIDERGRGKVYIV